MTCEVVVLNRLGLSLAADSAVTFRSVSANSDSTTYSSGANKIFQLTEIEPIGLMVYNNATLQGVPWELILKSFRSNFGKRSCQHLQDYKAELASYIENQLELFPSAYKESQTKTLLAQAYLLFIEQIRASYPSLLDPAKSLATDWANCISQLQAIVQSTPLNTIFDAADVVTSKQTYGSWLTQEIQGHAANDPEISHLQKELSDPSIAELIIDGAYKFFEKLFGANHSGVVFAGYGKTEYFPSYCETIYYGFLDSKLVWTEGRSAQVDHTRASAIEAFARQAMVETFLAGAAPSIWSTAANNFKAYAQQACLEVLSKSGTNLPTQDIDQAVQNGLNGFISAWQSNATSNHYGPLLSVIASLTVEELSELAETLVMLESLKEKVTSRTQSVGGPVDVATITKAEGLVWIKRKLYFTPELNQRYFNRQTLS